MERDLYPRRWGLGPVAMEKKKLKADGKLDKFGRTNEATPAKWQQGYTDYGAADAAAAAANVPAALEAPSPQKQIEAAPAAEEKPDEESKKRKKHDGETAEEKAARKRAKKEKKEKKEKKKSKEADDSD